MFISFEDFKKMPEYTEFVQQNPDIGHLKVEAFTAYGAIPISDTEIIITKEIGDYRVVFFRGYTDSSGIIYNKDGNVIGQVGVSGYLVDENNNLTRYNQVLGCIGDINDMGKSNVQDINNDKVIDMEKAKKLVYKPERPGSSGRSQCR